MDGEPSVLGRQSRTPPLLGLRWRRRNLSWSDRNWQARAVCARREVNGLVAQTRLVLNDLPARPLPERGFVQETRVQYPDGRIVQRPLAVQREVKRDGESGRPIEKPGRDAVVLHLV